MLFGESCFHFIVVLTNHDAKGADSPYLLLKSWEKDKWLLLFRKSSLFQITLSSSVFPKGKRTHQTQREMLGGTEAVQQVGSVCEAPGMLRRLLDLGHCRAGLSPPASSSPGAWGDNPPLRIESPSLGDTSI